MTIEINTINGIEFKANKKSSNYYIKENGGKFERVKVAEFRIRMEEEQKNEEKKNTTVVETTKSDNDFTHFILLETNKFTKIENVESFEMSILRRKYERNFVYLMDSIARKHGVLFALTTNRVNGQRAYKFFGKFDKFVDIISEYTTVVTAVRENAMTNNEEVAYVKRLISKNAKEYKNIDHLTVAFLKNRGTTAINF